jgi:pyruvate formate lyase activating enzyme
MRINGFTGVSLINYREKICSVIYTSPCNFKCPFCHNPALVSSNPFTIEEDKILEDIASRRNFIDGVAITGGEPAMQENIIEFMTKLKKMNLLVKLDTNGYFPQVIKEALKNDIVDHVSMDIKSTPDKYSIACGVPVDIKRIKESIGVIMDGGIDYDFRTTAVPGITEKEDFTAIGKMIKGARTHIIQQFSNENTLEKRFSKVKPFTENDLSEFADIMKKHVKEVRIHNIYALA